MDKIDAYRDLIMENIEYDILVERYGADRMDEVMEQGLETVCSKREYIRIVGDDYSAEGVKSRLLKIGSSHVEYIFGCIDTTTTKVHNIKAYLLPALYNAPATMDSKKVQSKKNIAPDSTPQKKAKAPKPKAPAR